MRRASNFKKAALLILALLLPLSIMLNASVDARFGASPIKKAKACLNEIIVNPGESIQDAIDKACVNATIFVKSGRYREHVNVTKPVRLIGEDSRATIIDGGGEDETIVNVVASNVEIGCFTVQNGSRYYPAYGYGIQIMSKLNVTIRGNVIREISLGIFLSNSNSCHIIDNTITGNYYYGVRLSDSCYNLIVGNNIINNSRGVWITSATSRANILYHNNFVNNSDQAPLPRGNATRWDNGAEGNYWSDYTGEDLNGDGVGDTPYPEDWPEFAFDKRPLMESWSLFRVHEVPWNGQVYVVTTYCNSTVASFNFSQSEKQIGFNVTGPSGAVGFCNVTIPKVLLNASAGDWSVLLDDANMTDFLVEENGAHTSICFTFYLTTHRVRIIGTGVIPEFPTALLLLIFMIASLIAIIFVRRSIK